MTTLEQLNLSQPLTDIYTAMETDLMMAIARQLARDGEISATSEWKIKKLAEAGALSKETVKIIASYTGIQSDLLTETIEASAYGIIDRLEPALQQVARDGLIGSVEHKTVSESTAKVVTNFRSQAKTDLNLVNTVMQYKAASAYTNLVNKIYDEANRQELLSTLGKHSLATATGAVSRQEAVRNCIKEFSQKGIPAFVDKAGREWSPEAYINMDIRTTVNNTAHAAQDACCDKYNIDLFQISSHNGARPKCAKDQGKLVSRSNRSGIAHDGNGNPIPFIPLSQTSYGQPDGIFGINCHHKKYPFIDGVNFQRYFPYDEEENAERYKELQKQRYLERRVRETSRQVDMLKEIGDTEGAKEARRKLTAQRKAYREYSDSHGLAQHNDRLTVTGVRKGDNVFADIHAKPLDNGSGSGIMKSKQYNFLDGVLGADAIPLDKAQNLDEIISVIPKKHLDAIEKTVKNVAYISGKGYCSYDPVTKTLTLYEEKMSGSIIHELGHVLADAYDIYNDKEFLDILSDGLNLENGFDVKSYYFDEEKIWLFWVTNSKFVSEYQGRIYIDPNIFSFEEPLSPNLFQEYISVGFETYFKNSNLLKEKDPKLFNYLERLMNSE